MLGRLGFFGRLCAILMLALIALWALGAGLTYVTRAPVVSLPSALPLPHQMAAIVELLESSDHDKRATILAATSSDTLRVSIADKAPEVPPEVRRLKGLEWLVSRYVSELGSRDVIASVDPEVLAEKRPRSRLWRLAQQPLRIAVGLRGGGYAVFETRGELSRRIFGLPPGFWIGVLGSLVGITALFAVWREARPLKELSGAVAQFARDGAPHRVPLRGAPELRRLIDEVNGMQERIATLLQGRTILLGAVSHDLKTYITRLKLRAEMIEDHDQRARAARDLDEMTALIEDALAVARGGSAYDRTAIIDLAELLRTVCADRPSIALSLPDGELRTEGDPIALRRVFDNLIDNVMRYGGERANVSVVQSRTGWSIVIDDFGPGIPEEERELAFEPFYRRDVSRSRVTGGSGLGLAIARQIVELHHGSIKLGDAASGGLRVRMELPRCIAANS